MAGHPPLRAALRALPGDGPGERERDGDLVCPPAPIAGAALGPGRPPPPGGGRAGTAGAGPAGWGGGSSGDSGGALVADAPPAVGARPGDPGGGAAVVFHCGLGLWIPRSPQHPRQGRGLQPPPAQLPAQPVGHPGLPRPHPLADLADHGDGRPAPLPGRGFPPGLEERAPAPGGPPVHRLVGLPGPAQDAPLHLVLPAAAAAGIRARCAGSFVIRHSSFVIGFAWRWGGDE